MSKEDIGKLIEQAAADTGLLIYEYNVILRGSASVVRVGIDSLSGIKHSDCEKFSEKLTELLDASSLLPNFALEVSSPGLNRKVRTEDEFRRFEGAPVKIVWQDSPESRKTIKGTIGKTADGNISVLFGQNQETIIPFALIVRANLDY